MKYGSVCSGIEAATVAWHPLGWKPSFFSEIDPSPRTVLAHHYPDVPLHGDFTTIQADQYDAIDLLVGGTPCQSFSVAGLRGGLADDRGNLALEYLRLAQRLRPGWLVWENVPGVLSSEGGRDFGSILGGLVELGYGFAYRVLDAQFVRVDGFGRAVPQRRRRVFVVGYLGDWRRAAAVLFERQSLRGDPAPRQQAGEVAPTVPSRSSAGGGLGTDFDFDEGLIPSVARCDTTSNQRIDAETETFVPVIGFNARQDPDSWIERMGPLDTDGGTHAVAFSCKDNGRDATTGAAPTLRSMGHADSHQNGGGQLAVASDLRGREGGAAFEGPHETANIRAASGGSSRSYVAALSAWPFSEPSLADVWPFESADLARTWPLSEVDSAWNSNGLGIGEAGDPCPTLQAGKTHGIANGWAVRRLTPRECERLQGFPDDYTLVPGKRGLMADGPRYKMLGNSMACNVMRWIGRRIEAVEAIGAMERLEAAE